MVVCLLVARLMDRVCSYLCLFTVNYDITSSSQTIWFNDWNGETMGSISSDVVLEHTVFYSVRDFWDLRDLESTFSLGTDLFTKLISQESRVDAFHLQISIVVSDLAPHSTWLAGHVFHIKGHRYVMSEAWISFNFSFLCIVNLRKSPTFNAHISRINLTIFAVFESVFPGHKEVSRVCH